MIDECVSAVFGDLESEFLIMPRGEGFIDYPTFEDAYQAVRRSTLGFSDVSENQLSEAVEANSLSILVLRTILGFTPPEWAYVATRRTGVAISQGYARSLDRNIRKTPGRSIKQMNPRLKAMLRTAGDLMSGEMPMVTGDRIHRLDKADTHQGLTSVRNASRMGIPYAMLLYERYLGRPFASHRDSVSELVGGGLEAAIEDRLSQHDIPYRKTKRAEQIQDFDQAPDFIIPDEFHPKAVIEAKVTEDDGTARDKITRVQHLDRLSRRGMESGKRRFQVIACIAGRGFGVRREDMKKLILATDGKVFSFRTLDRLVSHSALVELASPK